MGSAASHDVPPLPPPPAPTPAYPPPPPYPTDGPSPFTPQEGEKTAAEDEKVDYLNLPVPLAYEEIQREAYMSLKPDCFEGFRFDFTKVLTPYFATSHSIAMGSTEVPTQGDDVVKVPSTNYDYGANFLHPNLMLIGRMSRDGRMNARVKYDLADYICLKLNAQLTSEPGYSHGMGSIDFKGKDFRSQLQFGNNEFYGANYIQSVTKNLSLGTEAFWLGQQRKSGVGFVARYDTKKMVATGQIASTGVVSLGYVQKASDKVSLATDFMYNHLSKDVTASVGYDYNLRQCRLRGKIDTNGVVSALLEERLAPGLHFLLSAEVDHWRKDYKFGFGMTLGD